MPEAEAATSASPPTTDVDAPGATAAATAPVPLVTREESDGRAAPGSTLDDDTARRFWGEEDEPAEAAAPARRQRRRGRRARRVVRVVRHVSPWSVLKVSIPFFLCTWIVIVVAGVVLWRVGQQTGLVTNAENFWAEATGQESVEWDGEVLFRGAAMAGGVMAVACTGFAVLFAMLFNLICDITGGLRFTVLELEPPRPRPSRRERKEAAAASGGGSGGRRRRRR